MKFFWEGSSIPFADNIDGIAAFFGQPADAARLKALSGARIVNENGVPCVWDDVIGLVPDTEPDASTGKRSHGDPKPRPRSNRSSAARSK